MTRQKSTFPVYIRTPRKSDQKEYVNKVKSSQKFLRPWIYIEPSPLVFQKYLERIKRNNRGFFICDNLTDEIAGVININEIVTGGFLSGFLGYYAFKGFQRKGLMNYGLKLVLQEAFSELKLHRLEANIQPENKASLGLVKSCGFSKEGFSPRYLKVGGKWKDHERWAIIRENWHK